MLASRSRWRDHVNKGNTCIIRHPNVPFRPDFRLEGGGGVVDFESSDGREDGLETVKGISFVGILPVKFTHPGCDMTERRAPRREAGAAGAAGAG